MTTQTPDAVREAINAVRGISDDYQTSEVHHPYHVLIPLAKFEQLQAAEAHLAAFDVISANKGKSA